MLMVARLVFVAMLAAFLQVTPAYYVSTIRVSNPAAAKDDPSAPPILVTALQEQLGLKLRSAKARVPVLVVDRFVEPAAN